MGFQIQDGTGSSKKAQVTSRNRIKTDSVTEERAVFISLEEGKSFNVLTNFLTITGSTGVEDGIIYIKNNSDDEMFIHHLKIWCGTSGQFTKIYLYRNPTTGTLISSPINADTVNNNFGSSNTFEGLAYQGDGTNKTITDGDVFGRHYLGVGMQQIDMQMWVGLVVLPRGSSMAITAEAPNGQQVNIVAEINVYFESQE